MNLNQGYFSYPGIVQWEEVSFTDLSGISPSICNVRMYPQDDLPDAEGDITFAYYDQRFGQQTIVIKNCRIDVASYERNSGGKIINVRILDERWGWRYGGITGRYNYRNPNNWVDPGHEKTPRELATMCFKAMGFNGKLNYDVSDLPNDARPDINWDSSNPAQELAKLCDDLGCRIVPIRSTNTWKICVTGNGRQSLPNQWPYNDAGDGFDPAELPDFIQVVTGEKRFQVWLPLNPIGREINDLSLNSLYNLSYAPSPNDSSCAYGFGREPERMTNVSRVRSVLPDGSKVSPQELAQQSVFKMWQIKNDGSNPVIPGYSNQVIDAKQVILSNELVDIWTDFTGKEHARAAYIVGSFYKNFAPPAENGNCGFPTRIDQQGDHYQESPEDPVGFSISVNELDSLLTVINTSKAMTYLGTDANNRPAHTAAYLYLCCAVMVRDPDTWQPARYHYFQQVGHGSDGTFCMVIQRDDITPWYKTEYYTDSGVPPDISVAQVENNEDEVKKQCQYYADAYAKTLETVINSTRTYYGLFPIDMDGTTFQVSYRIAKDGASTIASLGTEHDFDIPDYWTRRMRDATHSAADAQAVWMQIFERKLRLQNRSHT